MKIKAHMLAFGGGGGKIREIDIPVDDIARLVSRQQEERSVFVSFKEEYESWVNGVLGLAFMYGQNDFQPLPFPSVSVGDVIELEEALYRVEGTRFARIERLP